MRAAIFDGRSARCSACLVGLAGLAMACQTPASIRYQSLSEDWQRTASPSERSRDSGEDLALGSASLDRRALIQSVLERNPNLEVARQAWRASLARFPQATGLDDPMLGVGVAPLSFGSSRVDPGASFDVSQRLPFPGKRRLRGDAALAEAEAMGQDMESLRLQLATLASGLFDDYALAARSLEINQEHTTLLSEYQRIALSRYAAGEDSKQSVLQAEMALTRALYERTELESSARIVAERINALLHRRVDLPLPAAPRELAFPEDPDDPIESLVTRALDLHPELAAASARVAAAEARVDLAEREFLPDFTLTGAYDRRWQESDLAPFVGVQVNVPLQLGRRRAALEESQADFEGTRQRRVAVEDDVRLAVQSASVLLEQARQAEQLVRDRLLPAAAEQVTAARSAYTAGSSTFLVLIDALRELHEIELGHQESLAQIGRRRAELDRALGRIPGLTW